MTLEIALVCNDGVIMASDSQATGSQHRVIVQKIYPLGRHGLWCAAGFAQPFDDMRVDPLQFDNPSANEIDNNDVGHRLANRYKTVMQKYANHVVTFNNQPPAIEAPIVMAAGYSQRRVPWIVSVAGNCMPQRWDQQGFYAIGSATGGAQIANAMLSHFEVASHSVDYGKLLSYRVMDTVIQVTPQGLGLPVKIWTVDRTGYHECDDVELEETRAGVEVWKDLEKSTLEQTVARLPGVPELDQEEGETPVPPQVDDQV